MAPGHDSDFERVSEAVDIADVVKDYVNLKQKRPGSWLGLCPFHKEKTPSFTVSSDKGLFYCFGCGKGGNIFTFLRELEGVSNVEALKMLAERAGIELTQRQFAKVDDKTANYKDQLLRVNQLAETRFHDNLLRKSRSREAGIAAKYLFDRGITKDIVKRYGLGWAEAGWEDLVKWIEKSKGDPSIAVDAGLASRRKSGDGYVDRFRGRIMFPIHNLSGKPVAFGGRMLENVTPDETPAKYINSPETAIYHKGENLYGLFAAREAIREKGFCFLVEGYTDLLALIQAGVNNVSASLGTSLTESQARLFKRFTQKVIVLYDSDLAGRNATDRAAGVLTLAGIEARAVILPEGDDPDTLLRSSGSDLLRETLTKEISFIDFHLQTKLPPEVAESASQSEKVNAANFLLETLRGVSDPIRRDLLLSELSESINVSKEALAKSLQKTKSRIYRSDNEAIVKDKLVIPAEDRGERDLLRAMLGHTSLIESYIGDVEVNAFHHPTLKLIFQNIEKLTLKEEKIEASKLANNFKDTSIKSFIAEAAIEGVDFSEEEARQEIEGCISALKLRILTEKARKTEVKIRSARKNGAPTRELLTELVAIQREIRGLKE